MYYNDKTNADRIAELWSNNIVNYPVIDTKIPHQPCIAEEFFKNNPRERVVMISCNCPRCTPWC